MSRFTPQVAKRVETPLRVLLIGYSKDGKSYTALALAHHLAKAMGLPPEAIVVIDSEVIGEGDDATSRVQTLTGEWCRCFRCDGRGIVLEGHRLIKLPPGTQRPEDYMEAMAAAAKAGGKILVEDGITPEWQALLRDVDNFKGRSQDAWAEHGQRHDAFLRTIESYPGHVIATCQVKDKAVIKAGNPNWDKKPCDPVQRDGIEYQFDVVMLLNSGSASCESRHPSLHKKKWDRPGADTADAMLAWSRAKAEAVTEAKALLEEATRLVTTLPEEERMRGTAWLAIPGNLTPDKLRAFVARANRKTEPEKPDPSPAGGPTPPSGAPSSGAGPSPAAGDPAPETTRRKPPRPGKES